MKILITGAAGQLGTALQRVFAGNSLTLLDLPETDISHRQAVFTVFQATQPQLVLHCAAYTNVDGCAQNPALAYKVNGLGTQNVALACLAVGAEMVHISTNEVFAGTLPTGYEEWMPLQPTNPYGKSKAAAEQHVLTLLKQFYIVRPAWLYAPNGRNFVHAILHRARTTGQIRVVTDEVGNPTYVQDLAQAIAQLIHTHQYGIYHLVNEGSCSRWAFANEILRLAGLDHVPNTPILGSEFQRPSTPPRFGALQNVAAAALGIRLRPWAEALAGYMSQHTPNSTP